MTYARGFLLSCFFGFLISVCGTFSANSNPLFISVVGYPLWCRVVCSSLRQVFFFFCFYPWLLCVFYVLECKGWILYSFWGGWFVVDIYDDLTIFRFFIRMSTNGNSFELCSIVNFILGCTFCNRLSNSLMSPHGHFQNMKQSSKYLFHDLVNSSFILLLYSSPII